jgi:hypothetical protein
MPRRRRWPAATLLALLLACAAGAHAAAPTFEQDESGLDARQLEASRLLLEEALSHLPASWTRSLPQPIRVQWRDDLPSSVHGRAVGSRMLLRSSLLDAWMARGVPADDAGHPHAALVAVIHELAHFHDRSGTGGLSRDDRLLDLAGWQVRPFRLLPRLGANAFSERSPDRYELEDPAEFVAVNLEHWLLDPEYACRRPALAAYFDAHFGQAPRQPDCAPDLPFLDPGAEAADALLELDPARVYQVDYLLAEGNERFMSRWGHSMLRLVVCAPGRPRGPDCRLDLAHHRVLSFRAFVGDVQISNWRGLTGSYPSRLFVLPLDQVVEEYARVELRGLVSLPLRLSPDEVASLLQRAARVHWSYDGSYRFIGNNCAVETFKLLHDGVPRLAGQNLASITPTGLQRRLQQQGLVDTTVLEDRDEAVRMGYRFEPLNAHYAELFQAAREALGLPQARVEDWLELEPGQRSAFLQRADLRSGAALLLLEQAALRRQELLARDELKRRFLGRGADAGSAGDALAVARELLRLQGALTRPSSLLPDGGYGLPQHDERLGLRESASEHVARWQRDGDELQRLARQWLSPGQRAALEGGEANLALLGERLRMLHQQDDGLQL